MEIQVTADHLILTDTSSLGCAKFLTLIIVPALSLVIVWENDIARLNSLLIAVAATAAAIYIHFKETKTVFKFSKHEPIVQVQNVSRTSTTQTHHDTSQAHILFESTNLETPQEINIFLSLPDREFDLGSFIFIPPKDLEPATTYLNLFRTHLPTLQINFTPPELEILMTN